MLEQFVAVMPGTLAPALLVMSLSVMLTVGEGRDKPISSHWRLIGLIVGLIAAIVFAGLRASAVINQRTFVNYPVLWCAIIADILPGLAGTQTPYEVIENRVEAIHYCMDHAQPGDVIVLCGKGHETYQEIQHVKHRLDEREIVAEYLAAGH